jgi:thymidylate synthase
MQQYKDLIREILEKGEEKTDRTGTGTISIFGVQKKYDLREGFPLVTVKKTLFDAVIRELLWFLKGSTNINDDLSEYTPIWDAWAAADGELGPVYGYQWRHWPKPDGGEVDQIANVIDALKNNPDSRRIIVNAWNVGMIDKMALPPCHLLFQFYVVNGRLDCQLYQRSADVGLGVPFNIASYAALMIMLAQECNLTPGIFTHTMGDAHIYTNHVEDLKQVLDRDHLPLPTLKLNKKPFDEITFEDFTLENYQHHPFIKLPVAV